MPKLTHIIALLFLIISAIVLIAFQLKPFGWILLACGAGWTTFFTNKTFFKDILLIYLSLFFLSLTPISTDIENQHFLEMTVGLLLSIAIPTAVIKYVYKENYLSPKFNAKRMFQKKELTYLLLLLMIVYFLFPYMLRVTGAYLNWTVKLDTFYLLQFFIGLNLVGLWDELFFISIVLRLLRRHVPFLAANFIQMTLFTSFLYKLGFQGWSFLAIVIFATFQGLMYRKTESLLYLITIHLSADLILFLVLIYLHYPSVLPIFLVK